MMHQCFPHILHKKILEFNCSLTTFPGPKCEFSTNFPSRPKSEIITITAEKTIFPNILTLKPKTWPILPPYPMPSMQNVRWIFWKTSNVCFPVFLNFYWLETDGMTAWKSEIYTWTIRKDSRTGGDKRKMSCLVVEANILKSTLI